MVKHLSDMSLEELWQLFPIKLVPHDPAWSEWYDMESKHISEALPEGSIYRVSHIGSTAIDSISVKPIVDILLEINDGVDMQMVSQKLIDAGYTVMSAEKMTFNKGYTTDGYAEKVFHLHLRSAGDDEEVYFRDYLNTHLDVAKEYETLKIFLAQKYEHDRDKYTDKKTAFVKKVLHAVKKL